MFQSESGALGYRFKGEGQHRVERPTLPGIGETPWRVQLQYLTVDDAVEAGPLRGAEGDRATDKVDKFSGGMKRRVNLAIALMSRPALLFLDEPTVGIDPQSRNHIFETILSLRAEGQTVLYTTHYMEEADRLCDRLGIIDHGRLIAEGSPEELKSQVGSPDDVTLEEVFLNLTGRRLRD